MQKQENLSKETYIEEQHRKWKALQKKRKCSDKSKMEYWKQVSHCVQL